MADRRALEQQQPDVSGRGREHPAATVGDRHYTTMEMLTVEGGS